MTLDQKEIISLLNIMKNFELKNIDVVESVGFGGASIKARFYPTIKRYDTQVEIDITNYAQ